jgi:pimeloyl-ACP methyl ester carboxylesterase
MKAVLGMAVGLILMSCEPSNSNNPRGGDEVTFSSSDKVKVYADLYKCPKPQGIVLMFHQARSSALEYAPIAPKVTALGFDCLAVDLRSGGDMYGPNRTVGGLEKNADYLDAYKDMESALKWAIEHKYPRIFVWGSSYSASLAFKLAKDHKEIWALVVFSPGEYFDEKGIVTRWRSEIKIPVLAICTLDERNSVESIIQPKRSRDGQILSSSDYIHGSSTLRPDKGVKNTQIIWSSIEKLLKKSRLLPE